METAGAIAFLIFALGFFMYVLQFISSSDRERRQQRLDEIREFGEEKTHRPILREILKKF